MDIKQVLQGVKTWSTNSFYTKEEVNQLVGTLSHFEAVSSLPPVSEASGDVLYLVGPTGNGSDKYEEYVLSNGAFIKIGDTSIDLSGYLQSSDIASWAKEANKPSYSYSEISNTPTNVSDFTNDAGYLTVVNQAYPSGWRTNGTMENLIDDINADSTAVVGKSYLKTVSISDLPAGLIQAEMKAEIMEYLPGTGKVIVFTVTSSGIAPYHWEYTSIWGAVGEWRSFLIEHQDISSKQDVIQDLNDIRTGAAAGATAYQKPSGGIPAADIASGVIPNVSNKVDKVNGTNNNIVVFGTNNSIKDSGKSINDFALASSISSMEYIDNKVTSLSSESTDEEYPSAKTVYKNIKDVAPIHLTQSEFAALSIKDPNTIYIVAVPHTVQASANGHPYVDLGLTSHDGQKLYVSTTNLGASSFSDIGDYYAWGETDKGYESIEYTVGDNYYDITAEITGFVHNDSEIPGLRTGYILPSYKDAASIQWGGGWRMPTADELVEIMKTEDSDGEYGEPTTLAERGYVDENGDIYIFDYSNYGYVKFGDPSITTDDASWINVGLLVYGRDSYSSNYVFLPSAGYINEEYGEVSGPEGWLSRNSSMCYWSSEFGMTGDEYLDPGSVYYMEDGEGYGGFSHDISYIKDRMLIRPVYTETATEYSYQIYKGNILISDSSLTSAVSGLETLLASI